MIRLSAPRELTAGDAPRLRGLCRRGGSHFRDLLIDARADRIRALFVEATDDRSPRVIGWSAAWVAAGAEDEVVMGVYVRASARGRGIGTILAAACNHAARQKWPNYRVTVFPVDAAGRAMYRGIGFNTPEKQESEG